MSMNWLEGLHQQMDGPGQPQAMAMPVFAGQKLVVVGGSSGMGRQTAEDVVAAGGSAVIIGQRPDRVDDTVQTLTKAGTAYGITADLTDRTQAEQVCQRLAAEHADATLLVNAAGLFIPKPLAPSAIWPTPSRSCSRRPPAGSPASSGTWTAASWPDATNAPPVRHPDHAARGRRHAVAFARQERTRRA